MKSFNARILMSSCLLVGANAMAQAASSGIQNQGVPIPPPPMVRNLPACDVSTADCLIRQHDWYLNDMKHTIARLKYDIQLPTRSGEVIFSDPTSLVSVVDLDQAAYVNYSSTHLSLSDQIFKTNGETASLKFQVDADRERDADLKRLEEQVSESRGGQ